MFTIDDIQFFIQTHNRAHLLPASINALLSQSAGIKEITVLDNESTDNTEEIVRQFAGRGVKYIKTYGLCGNYRKAVELANRTYCMIFHDDDLLHPEYIKIVLELLNRYENVSLIHSTAFEFTSVPAYAGKVRKDHYIFKTPNDFAKFYFFASYQGGAVICRTKELVSLDMLKERDEYGKLDDFPRMTKIMSGGIGILLWDANLHPIRNHPDRDSVCFDSVPTPSQIANYFILCRNLIEPVLTEKEIPLFIKRMQVTVRDFFKCFVSPDMRKEHFAEFTRIAYEKGLRNFDYSEYTKPELVANRKLVSRLRKTNLVIQKRWLRFLFDVYENPDYKIYTLLGIKIKFSKH